jgi:hypothetical protein
VRGGTLERAIRREFGLVERGNFFDAEHFFEFFCNWNCSITF